MNFVHTADAHLGYLQYGLMERFRDYARAFKQIVDYTLSVSADFMLISGDLFHYRSINSPTYVQVYKLLEPLKEAGIPVLAIEGNHDLAFEKDRYSWLSALEAQGLLRLLNPSERGILAHEVIEAEERVRVFGTRWLGSSTAQHIPQIAHEIAREGGADYTVLMMHCGLEGTSIKASGEVSMGTVMQLKGMVDYLALGHYHVPFERDGWIYNPGSPEMVSLADIAPQRGFFHTTNGKTSFVPIRTRPIVEVSISSRGLASPEQLYEQISRSTLESMRDVKAQEKPIVVLNIEGALEFSRSALSTSHLIEAVEKVCDVLTVRPRLRLSHEGGVPVRDARATMKLDEVERQVLMSLVSVDGRYRGVEKELVDAVLEIKEYAASGETEKAYELVSELFSVLRGKKDADKPA